MPTRLVKLGTPLVGSSSSFGTLFYFKNGSYHYERRGYTLGMGNVNRVTDAIRM